MYVCIFIYVSTYVRMYVFNVAELFLHMLVPCKKIAGAQLRAIQSHPYTLEWRLSVVLTSLFLAVRHTYNSQ